MPGGVRLSPGRGQICLRLRPVRTAWHSVTLRGFSLGRDSHGRHDPHVAPLLQLTDLRVDLPAGDGRLVVVDGVSLEIGPGEIVGLVGESGCGKSVTAQTITRLVPGARITRGSIHVEGQDVGSLGEHDLRRIRGGVVAHVFQDPAASLNPWMRVGAQIREVLALHRPGSDSPSEVLRLLRSVGISAPELRIDEYPHRLSGGMQQRVMIAMAIAAAPSLLVADEPTTALDVTIQAQILDLFRGLRDRTGMAILLITHNLGVVAELADRVAVMYAGQIVESGPTADVLASPRHPYTRALLGAMPDAAVPGQRLEAIPGSVPRPGYWPSGCHFAPRCREARPTCAQEVPAWTELPGGGGRGTRCPFEA
jgi:oligopeptide/dipeptide ABC transporter ATP-binding protein